MLIVALDTSKKEPLYEQIYNSIKEEGHERASQ